MPGMQQGTQICDNLLKPKTFSVPYVMFRRPIKEANLRVDTQWEESYIRIDPTLDQHR